MSLNVFKSTLDQIVGPNGNKEFTDLITVLGCNVGPKFDINKLQFSKIIIASDADVDGLFIRSLLMAFFFKMFPEIIADGRLYIAEPPLYRVNDKNNPFVINNEDYNNRYANNASKEYKIGYISDNDEITFLNKKDLTQLLSDTSSYVDDIQSLSEHYKVNDRLLEFIVEELSLFEFKDTKDNDIENIIKQINSQVMMNKLNEEFPELNYNDDKHLIYGTINTVMQMIEISVPLVRKSLNLIKIIQYWNTAKSKLVLKKINTGTEYRLSLLGILKILKKYQPEKLHRFKGLNTRPYQFNCRKFLRAHLTAVY